MKKNRITLIIVIVLLAIAVLLIVRNTSSTLNRELKNFAITDTASVSKIFMSDKKNNKILLIKKPDGKWQVNEKYPANTDIVNNLLYTMHNIAVSSPVPMSMRNSVISRMAVLAVKVEIYSNVYRINLFDKIHLFRHEKLIKTFYVGDNTRDNMGTYMLIEGSDEPFVTYIPSFRGFLSTRFVPNENVWRDYTIFNYQLKDIKSVSIEFPQFPDSSFVIDRANDLKYSLTPLSSSFQPPASSLPYDTIKLLQFLSSFQKLRFEALINDIDKQKRDSIISSSPWHIITVTGNNGKSAQNKTYHKKPAYGDYYDEVTKQRVIYDRDRLYALINNDKDLTLIQFFMFGKILRTINYFRKS